ncbi:DNA-directed RNA polymerase subunit delta [Erysipelothrix larvae]|uniref:RNAP delta factor n=1 Tax=Erysipelothrix larvae TaxID=1514105 RepID=A0A0X8H1U1_9FIRM|nr:DNA-directed RNA polymerase subunit delta [Erysipelothrix larvae]AMC94525.1 DNA-directed RNA polymerase subunit delta [Erysipelothrix larvae]
MAGNSLSDVAYRSLKRKRKQVVFNKLWKEVCDDVGYTDEMAKKKIASFYNALMLDSRFISLEGNQWDLRERYAEDTLKIDPELTEAYEDYEEFEEEEFEEEEGEI